MFATQRVVVFPEPMPQGLTRLASVVSAAVPPVSATRFVTVNDVGAVTFTVADFAAFPALLPLHVRV